MGADRIIMVFVTMLIGASLVIPFVTQTDDVVANTTGAVASMSSFLGLLFVIIIVAVGVSYIKFKK